MARLTERDRKLLKGGRRIDQDGWIHLRTSGDAHARGFQHGYLVAREIRDAIANLRYLILHDTGLPFSWFARNAQALFDEPLRSNLSGALGDNSGARIIEELEGIVEGANRNRGARDPELSLADLLGWNGYPELICQWLPAVLQGSVKPAFPIPAAATPVAPSATLHPHHQFHHSCSGFVATGKWTADGGIVAAQTTWQRFANGDAYNVIADINPESGHRLVMQSVPGYVNSSTDFSVTGAGLVVAETSINGLGFSTTGLPEFFRSRRACQYATNIKSWRDLFRTGNNGGYTNSWLLADAKRGEIACYELTLKHDVLHPIMRSGYYAGYNIPLDVRVRNLDCPLPSGYDDVRTSGARRVRFDALMAQHKGAIDATIAQTILSDHHDACLGMERATSRTICGHFDNDEGTVGGLPGAHYPWGSLDGKVTTAALARGTKLLARWGRACGTPLLVDEFLRQHPEYEWLRGHMKDRPTQPWAEFPTR